MIRPFFIILSVLVFPVTARLFRNDGYGYELPDDRFQNNHYGTDLPYPNNDASCPTKMPDLGAFPRPSCDSTIHIADCKYSPVPCMLDPNLTCYNTFCNCMNDELVCTVASGSGDKEEIFNEEEDLMLLLKDVFSDSFSLSRAKIRKDAQYAGPRIPSSIENFSKNFPKEINTEMNADGGSKCPSKCNLQPDSGFCVARFYKWHYDPNDRQCKEFVYGGCYGNENRFESQAECQNECGMCSSSISENFSL